MFFQEQSIILCNLKLCTYKYKYERASRNRPFVFLYLNDSNAILSLGAVNLKVLTNMH